MFKDKEYVLEVYRQLSFSKAASRMYISQPSLSAKIKKIEKRLGAEIFDRSTSPLRLTEFGKIYIEALGEIQKIERKLQTSVEDITTLRTGEVSIGASNIFAAYFLPPLISKYKAKFPNVKIRLIEDNSPNLEKMLSQNELDIILDNKSYDPELYETVKYTNERILLAVPKGYIENRAVRSIAISEYDIKKKRYEKSDYPCVDLKCFSDIPFVLLTPTNDTRVRGERMCREAGFRPHVVLETHQQSTAYMISVDGVGATFISDTVVEKLPEHDRLFYYKLASQSSTRTVYFTFRKHTNKTVALTEFLNLVKNGKAFSLS
jgi:DNA-binding transcriptional LysR family regulator